MKKRKIKWDELCFRLVGGLFVGGIATVCLIPFIMLISGSFTSESYILRNGYPLFPHNFSTEAYKFLMKSWKQILLAYKNSLVITVVGTALGLFLTAMTGYVLSRKDFKWRNKFAFFFFFTTLFSGGLVPWYIVMTKIGVRNTLWSIILPNLLTVFNILIMRNFMLGIPKEIIESGKIDGANDFVIFIRLVLPILKPALATIGLFLALAYWNDWYHAMLFINKKNLFPLQYYLYDILNSAISMQKAMEGGSSAGFTIIPTYSAKLAMTVIATGPIVLLYPFIQKYFIKGITVGAVKA